jgi:hypothetical protein
MDKHQRQINDVLNLLVGGGLSVFLTLLFGSLLIGMILEKDKAETFLVMLGIGGVLGGLGCGVYCLHILNKRGYKPLYRAAMILTVAGFIFVLIGAWLYENN